ncbi:hypothetical protein Taro_050797 [Colocasia esculenta]|uniref:Uncharacterized protein n=1 Tax=Colocasia esculenta TaxID=4460 RepID=A0A843XF81_COLES|nr:hypothetical protein [Colocasia esculenta]
MDSSTSLRMDATIVVGFRFSEVPTSGKIFSGGISSIRLPMATDSFALASAGAGASSDRAAALSTSAAAWSTATEASACTDSSRTTADSELCHDAVHPILLQVCNIHCLVSTEFRLHKGEPFLLLCCEELGSIAPDAAGNNRESVLELIGYRLRQEEGDEKGCESLPHRFRDFTNKGTVSLKDTTAPSTPASLPLHKGNNTLEPTKSSFYMKGISNPGSHQVFLLYEGNKHSRKCSEMKPLDQAYRTQLDLKLRAEKEKIYNKELFSKLKASLSDLHLAQRARARTDENFCLALGKLTEG